MKYDFTSVLNRSGNDSIAVDVPPDHSFIQVAQTKEGFDRIPMWIADMSFPTVPTVVNRIIDRATHPAYGYFTVREEYFEKIIKWQEIQHGVKGLEKEHIGYENSVLGGVVTALNILCSKGDKILLHSPTYVGFTGSLGNNGYEIVHSPLIKDENNIWRMDYEDMEEKLKTHNIHATVFCSPHNPTGRVWESWELEKAMNLFEKYDVYVVSDEIWADLTLDNYKHIPTQSISSQAKERTIALYAPSKTFNLAGLISSYHIIYNKRLSDRVKKESSLGHYNKINVLSMHALIGAYEVQGQEWLSELKEVLSNNISYAYDFFSNKVKGVSVAKPQATYLLLIDCSEWLKANSKTLDELLNLGYEYGVIWQDGRNFFAENSIRINLALPFSQVEEAISRLEKYVFNS